MNITEVKEQDRPMVVYDSDGRGLEDHGVPPPPFLEGSSSTPLTLMELLDNFSTVDANFIMLQHEEVSALQDTSIALEVQWLKHKLFGCFSIESTSDKEMLDVVTRHSKFHWARGSINMPPSIVEFTIAWFIEKRDLRRNWQWIAYELEFPHLSFRIAPNNEFSCFHFAFNTNLHTPNYKVVYASEIGGALVWEEAIIDVDEPHAKAIREVVHQIPGLMHGLFVLREGAMYWHPRMPVHSKMLQQEKWDMVNHKFYMPLISICIGCLCVLRVYNCNIGNCSWRGCGGMYGCSGLALPIHQAKRNGRLTLRWLPTLNVYGNLLEALQESSIARWAFTHWDRCFVTGLLGLWRELPQLDCGYHPRYKLERVIQVP
ncbi:hypothetical protein SELMODRAFT_418019 [Selaginella moellendorffii]|uniref:Uncharacterized protein n=1 Tax=Selaginella moellendorffii TaxID=88036 RepID=D8S4E4_SELML|nr:hypothetical protein SELMODRAFT_418019 [Selaginella moellendorffii]